ncbi:MAG: hypothetical protein D6786_07020 [Gammaproteobacteria bacterium]|nr:MAG: hypothetical protein D6786_07020 [Gammaproteobacteria bacterium]
MPRSGLSREEVFSAASELVRAGRRPTVAAVRERLGRGSYTTITQYLGEWREESPPEETRPVAVDEALAVLGVDASSVSGLGEDSGIALLLEGLRGDLLQGRARIDEALARLEALERLVRES